MYVYIKKEVQQQQEVEDSWGEVDQNFQEKKGLWVILLPRLLTVSPEIMVARFAILWVGTLLLRKGVDQDEVP